MAGSAVPVRWAGLGDERSGATMALHATPESREAWLFVTEVAASWLVAGVVAFLLDIPPLRLTGALGVWFVLMAAVPSSSSSRNTPVLRAAFGSAVVTISAAAATVAFLGQDSHLLADVIDTLVAACAGLFAVRLLWRWWHGPQRVLVVGDPGAAARTSRRLSEAHGVRVIGTAILDPVTGPIGPVHEVPGLPGPDCPDDLAAEVEARGVDTVVVAFGAGLDPAGIQRLTWQLEDTGADLTIMGALASVAPHRVSVSGLAGSTVVAVTSSRPRALVRGAKVLGDRALGLVLLVVAAPVIAAMALAIRLETPGGAIFGQVRVGQHGKPFTMYKMRTMRRDAESLKPGLADLNEGAGVLFKLRWDPRITRIGRLLRTSSLDELPQLLNVVRGEMSLVGPRPALPDEVAAYDELARRRLAVRPGITGLWQVSGRSDLDWDQSVALDVCYTDNVTFARDLSIGVRTLGAVAHAKGAY